MDRASGFYPDGWAFDSLQGHGDGDEIPSAPFDDGRAVNERDDVIASERRHLA